jgi:hypothetical protein
MSDIIRRDQVFTGRKLASLPKTQFSGLDFDNIIADITELVTENPEYNKNWDDFLSSNAGRLMIEFFAYIADQLSTRIDWIVNENFIGTATQKKSIIRLLKLIGYNLDLPKAAKVNVDIFFDRPVGNVEFSGTGIGESLDFFSLTAVGLDGIERKNFEAISFNEETQKYNYINSIIELETGSASQPSLDHTVSFYEGRTFVFDIEVSTNNNFTFQLPQFPVIQGSPRVYLLKPQNQEEELEQVLSFLDPIAQRENDGFGARNPIPYILNVLDQDIVEVEFGPTSLLSNVSRRPEVGNIIRVYYRVGGGESGNITRKSINTTRRLEFNNILTNISFINNSQGFGGEEGEDAAFASVFGPLQIKTVNKAVTEEDYDILLLGNINVIKSKSYGNNNLPPQFFQRYNVFMRPLEVWNYSILNKSGFTEVPPSRYDDFEWIQLRLENRFNQKHSFTKGKFNDAYTIFSSQIQRNLANEEINISEDESSIPKNFILINTNQDFKNSLNENFRLKATSKELSDNYFFLTKENNIFNKQVELKNTGEIDFSKNVNEIKQEEKAHYVSTVNLDDNFSISELPATPKNLKIGFDNREPIEIDLTEAIDSLAGEIPPKVTPEEISNYINEKFTESLDYNDSDLTEEFGRQKLGLNISDFEEVIASFLRNKNYYFKVNGIEFFINTGQEDVTYNILREKIDKSFGVEFKGNIFNGSNKVVITDGNFRKNFINKGAKVLSEVQTTTEEAPPINDLDIDEYNWITDEITLSGNSTATRTNHSFRVRTFCTICENGNDIEIRNLSKEPYGVVLLQESDRDPEEDLFTVLGVNLQEPINCRGVSGYNNLGIKGVITATRGFQAFEVTNDISAITGERKFNLEINNLDDYGELIEDITVNFGTGGKNLDFVRQEIISQLEESYIDYNDLEIPQLNVYDDLRIISKEKGDFSTIRILPPSTGSSLIPSLGGVENPVDGIDSPVLGLETGEYSFKINNHTYKIDINEEDTFEDLIDILNGNEYENPVLDYFTASIVFEEDNQKEWERDIRITNNFSDRVYIEDINFFQNLKTERLVNKYERIEQENWEEFGDIIGGGDYSAVSGTFSALKDEGQETYLYLRSPSIGRYNSIINFYPVSSRNATAGIFGIVSNEEEKNYGYRKLSVIRSEGNNFGNVIYENGSLNFFGSDVEQIFLNYIFDSINQITLGRFNTDNFEREDPSYREPALRLYNTVYNQQSKEIDYFNSNFILKYTKEETDEISIFSIENNWEQLTRVTPAEISSRENPQDFINSDFYLIKLNIDNIGDVEIDLSGDFGQNPGTYNLQDIVNIINNSLQQDSNYNFSVYSSFNFATIIENKIVIRSPISTSNSKVIFKKPSVEEADASNEIFFINYIDGEREIITTGDYYIIENRQTIKGNLTTETNVITGISSEDFEKIQVGDKIYEKLNTTRRCFVLSKSPENNSIKLSLPVLTTGNNIEFDFSNNLMMLNKIEKEESFVPDLDFYLHFINDRRYVEEIFGGEVIIDEDTGIPVKLPGNSLGSLDEDRLISFMNDKKIVSVENVFKQTKFRTFDIKANVYYNKAFSRDDVRQRVEKSLRDFYNLRNRNYAEGVSRSKIMSIIHDNFGVEFVEIEYLGYDATKPETSVENVLSPAFDEIIVLSENKSFGGRIIRGLIFNYLVENN